MSSRPQVNNCNENHYPTDDAEIDGDDRSMPAKAKLAYLFDVMAQA
jgi:hypothetical protein